MEAEISDIPLDLVENILLRLEPRILLGLSRVCKDWSYLISSRQFWMRKLSCSGITNLPQRVLFNDCLDWRFYYLTINTRFTDPEVVMQWSLNPQVHCHIL